MPYNHESHSERKRWKNAVNALLMDIANDEDPERGGGEISSSAYETAWVAMVRNPDDHGKLAFPSALEWLVATQRADGSWRPDFPFSLLSTMAATLALKRAPHPTEKVRRATDRARRYLEGAIHRWPIELLDDFDTPFFEFLIPLLAHELAQVGIALSVPHLDVMEQRSQAKLSRLPLKHLYEGPSTLSHVLEALGSRVDDERLLQARPAYGGYGNSPSATAAALMHSTIWDTGAADWLRSLASRAPTGATRGGMPCSHPADAFEASWVLHLLQHSGHLPYDIQNPSYHHIVLWLLRCLSHAGVSFARETGVATLPCDMDDTALTLAVLRQCGARVSLDSLWAFEAPTHFVSYAGERTTSTSANAHALEAIVSAAPSEWEQLAGRRQKVIDYLLGERTVQGFWRDKWHLSSYYATMSCMLALTKVPRHELGNDTFISTFAWLIWTQRPDGGWGMKHSTLEESAYALLTLRALLRTSPSWPHVQTQRGCSALERGRAFLMRHYNNLKRPDTLPTYWLDKTLYCPTRVVRAAVLAALAG